VPQKILDETAIIGKDDINAYDELFKFVSELLNIKYENGIFDFDEFDRQFNAPFRVLPQVIGPYRA
jgi:hypothetical protein